MVSGDYHRLLYVLIQNMVFPASIFLFIHSNMSRIFFSGDYVYSILLTISQDKIQLTFTCSNLTIETLEKEVKYLQS